MPVPVPVHVHVHVACLRRVLQDWLVPASLSDDEIELLLELLPPASELYARAAGERRAGSGKRRNDWSTHRADIGGGCGRPVLAAAPAGFEDCWDMRQC